MFACSYVAISVVPGPRAVGSAQFRLEAGAGAFAGPILLWTGAGQYGQILDRGRASPRAGSSVRGRLRSLPQIIKYNLPVYV
jgi:hypothetical protein